MEFSKKAKFLLGVTIFSLVSSTLVADMITLGDNDKSAKFSFHNIVDKAKTHFVHHNTDAKKPELPTKITIPKHNDGVKIPSDRIGIIGGNGRHNHNGNGRHNIGDGTEYFEQMQEKAQNNLKSLQAKSNNGGVWKNDKSQTVTIAMPKPQIPPKPPKPAVSKWKKIPLNIYFLYNAKSLKQIATEAGGTFLSEYWVVGYWGTTAISYQEGVFYNIEKTIEIKFANNKQIFTLTPQTSSYYLFQTINGYSDNDSYKLYKSESNSPFPNLSDSLDLEIISQMKKVEISSISHSRQQLYIYYRIK